MTTVILTWIFGASTVVLLGLVSYMAQEYVEQRKLLSDRQHEIARLGEALVQLTDGESAKAVLAKIKGDLPVRQPPNKTPCGRLCRYAYWDKEDGYWRCTAYQGMGVNHVRPNFQDENGQCVMFRVRPGEEHAFFSKTGKDY